jgi:hypothetical protein
MNSEIVEIRSEAFGWSQRVGNGWAPLPFTPLATVESVTAAVFLTETIARHTNNVSVVVCK